MEASHEFLAILNALNASGTVGALAIGYWLFVSGRIMATAGVRSVAIEAASATVQELQERGIIPPTPQTPRGYGQSGRSKDTNSDID